MIWTELKQEITYQLTCMRICDVFCFLGPLVSLLKYKNNMRRSVIFNESTEINAPPQVSLSLNETSSVLFAVK